MPITPSYSWHETSALLTIHVSLTSVSPASIDIVTTECFVKVNCKPYFFQADLFGLIDTHKSSATVVQNEVKFSLVKKEEGIWGRLTITAEREMVLERREKSLDEIRKLAEKRKAEAGAKFSQIGRRAVESQLKLDEARHKTIDMRKAAELKKERDDIRHWQSDLKESNVQPRELTTCLGPHRKFLEPEHPALRSENQNLQMVHDGEQISEKETHNDKYRTAQLEENPKHPERKLSALQTDSKPPKNWNGILERQEYGNIPSIGCKDRVEANDRDANISYHSTGLAGSHLKESLKLLKAGETILPAPRKSYSIPVTFTSKPLPQHLPARESREKLQLKDTSRVSTDTMDISEREPLFLQDKGNNFYQAGDFRSAINAYTKALEKDTSLLCCYANRAACYLQTQEPYACIRDCTCALELLHAKFSVVTEDANRTSNFKADVKLEFHAVEAAETTKEACQTSLALFEKTGCLNLLSLTNDQNNGDIVTKAADGAHDSCKIERSCLFSRRGAARFMLGDVEEAIIDLTEAQKLHPSNKGIDHVLSQIKSRRYESQRKVSAAASNPQ